MSIQNKNRSWQTLPLGIRLLLVGNAAGLVLGTLYSRYKGTIDLIGIVVGCLLMYGLYRRINWVRKVWIVCSIFAVTVCSFVLIASVHLHWLGHNLKRRSDQSISTVLQRPSTTSEQRKSLTNFINESDKAWKELNHKNTVLYLKLIAAITLYSTIAIYLHRPKVRTVFTT